MPLGKAHTPYYRCTHELPLGDTSEFHPTSLITIQNIDGRTPLHIAAQSGNLDAIGLWVDATSNKDDTLAMQDDNGSTAWRLATKFKHREAASMLTGLRFR